VKDVMTVSVIASEPIFADRSRAALGDVLVTFPAERMLLFTRPNSKQRYDQGIDAETLQQRFGCRSNRLNEKPERLSAQRRREMRTVSHP
jgi:hypothetical protein